MRSHSKIFDESVIIKSFITTTDEQNNILDKIQKKTFPGPSKYVEVT